VHEQPRFTFVGEQRRKQGQCLRMPPLLDAQLQQGFAVMPFRMVLRVKR
jgi:hypothetical protein